MLRTPERCHPLPCAALLTLLSLGPLSTPTVAAPKSAKAPSAQALVQRAGAAYREGRHLEAARAYAEALALVPDPIYFTNLVKTLRYADDAAAALRLLQETLASYPADKHPDFKDRAEAQDKVLPELQALMLEQQGDRLAAAQPGDAVAAYHLGNLLRPRARARRKEADLLRKLGRLPAAHSTEAWLFPISSIVKRCVLSVNEARTRRAQISSVRNGRGEEMRWASICI